MLVLLGFAQNLYKFAWNAHAIGFKLKRLLGRAEAGLALPNSVRPFPFMMRFSVCIPGGLDPLNPGKLAKEVVRARPLGQHGCSPDAELFNLIMIRFQPALEVFYTICLAMKNSA